MKNVVWSEQYRIPSYFVSLRERASLSGILNLIQDVGFQHAFHLDVKLAPDRAWVFTRQKLVMDSWPRWNETLTLKTWLRAPEHASFLMRDYDILIGDQKIGECTSAFTVIDTKSRKIAAQDWTSYHALWQADCLLSLSPQKIKPIENCLALTQFQVRNSDLDLNFHVNNTKYAQWILDALPLDTLRSGDPLLGYEVNFLSEMKIGDVIEVQQNPQPMPAGSESLIHFQGVRVSDGKVAFTAQMRLAPASV